LKFQAVAEKTAKDARGLYFILPHPVRRGKERQASGVEFLPHLQVLTTPLFVSHIILTMQMMMMMLLIIIIIITLFIIIMEKCKLGLYISNERQTLLQMDRLPNTYHVVFKRSQE